MTGILKAALAQACKWLGWRLVRLADKLDDEPVKAGGTSSD